MTFLFTFNINDTTLQLTAFQLRKYVGNIKFLQNDLNWSRVFKFSGWDPSPACCCGLRLWRSETREATAAEDRSLG